MEKIITQVNVSDFPSELSTFFDGATVYDSHCRSGAGVLYLDTGYFLKYDVKNSLAREAEMADLFYKLGLGVEPVAYISRDRDYFVTRAADGEDMTHYLNDPTLVCDALAEAMVRLHSFHVGDAPISLSLKHYAEATSFDESNYDESFLSAHFAVSSKSEAKRLMNEYKGAFATDTLIHGDFCLPNVILKGGRFGAFVDLGLAGAGDRHIDVYWALWTLAYNLGTDKYADRFLDAYGKDKINPDMLRAVASFEAFG